MSDQVSESEQGGASRKAGVSFVSHASAPIGRVAVGVGLAFGMVIVLLIVVGDLGIRRIDQINTDLQNTMGQGWVKMRLTREAVTYSGRNSRNTMEIFLIRDKKQILALLAARSDNSNRISGLLTALEGLCKSEEEKRRLTAVKEARKPYIDSYLRAIRLLLDERKHEAAVAVMVQQTTPALLRYQAAWDEFLRYQEEQLESAPERTTLQYAATHRTAMFGIIASVVLAGVIAFLVVRRLVGDITARVRDEKEALHTAHQEAEVFINAVPSILIGLDRRSRITRWNSTAARVFGLVEREVAGKTLVECGIKWLNPSMQDEVELWFSGQSSQRCDRVTFQMNGETRLLGLTATRVQMAGEDLTKLLVIGSDTTQRTMLEDQLRQAQKLESVGQLAAGIAHEINTPTQYIGDNVRFLQDAFQQLKGTLEKYEGLLAAAEGSSTGARKAEDLAASEERQEVDYLLEEIPKAIEQTLEGVMRVSTLVSAMKEFSHPGTKEKTLLDLNHAIQSTITVARNEWKYVADMETDFDPSLPLVSCRPGEFNQVILNLIVNAAHAIGEVVAKGVIEKGTIKVQTRNCAECCEIRIQDTGAGIPEKVRAKIFDPFFTTKEIGKGTGQGLAIAHSVVVDKHGGTIHFETQEGVGTTFIIRLPWQESEAEAAKAVSA